MSRVLAARGDRGLQLLGRGLEPDGDGTAVDAPPWTYLPRPQHDTLQTESVERIGHGARVQFPQPLRQLIVRHRPL